MVEVEEGVYLSPNDQIQPLILPSDWSAFGVKQGRGPLTDVAVEGQVSRDIVGTGIEVEEATTWLYFQMQERAFWWG